MAEMRIIHCVVLFSVLAISCGLPTAANRRIRRLIGDPDAVNDSTGKAARRHHGQHVGDDDGEIQASRLDQLANRSTSRTVDDVDDSEMGEFLWRKIEHRVLHHLRRTEEKLMEHVEDKTSGLNQSITINYLYKVYHYLIEEVEIGKRIGEMRAGEIEKVRKIAVEQGKKIVALENSVLSLRRLLDNVTESLRSMDASRQPEGVQKDAMTSTVSPSTTAFRIRPQLPADCHEVYQLGGMKYDGDYFIKINPYLSDQPFEVCCRMVNNAGWTVIQRRRDGSVDFYQNWEEYKGGFGDPRGEFWIGNDHIYELTNQGQYSVMGGASLC
ncbi:hypothetical protein LSH36_84g07012 [Paralvinella palmiformis]|uniref:Fibrinogen C-terminal domain-containing protein n=1 Tax=Paralvinella palmiformis TaxID=53620 RepID=A0AAD9K1S4_9ANNE|nr:hypothetical protein LSH36_84g07012 [Paralvinella palmiformis]